MIGSIELTHLPCLSIATRPFTVNIAWENIGVLNRQFVSEIGTIKLFQCH